jgi:hypothetical protein
MRPKQGPNLRSHRSMLAYRRNSTHDAHLNLAELEKIPGSWSTSGVAICHLKHSLRKAPIHYHISSVADAFSNTF